MTISDRIRDAFEDGQAERASLQEDSLLWVMSGSAHPRPTDPDAAAAWDKGFRDEQFDGDKRG